MHTEESHKPVVASVAPADQTTTNSYADCGVLDAYYYSMVSFTIYNHHATNGIHWKVLASNDSDFTTAIEVKAEADVAGHTGDSYSTTAAVWRYYKVQVQAGVPDTQGTAVVRGLAKR